MFFWLVVKYIFVFFRVFMFMMVEKFGCLAMRMAWSVVLWLIISFLFKFKKVCCMKWVIMGWIWFMGLMFLMGCLWVWLFIIRVICCFIILAKWNIVCLWKWSSFILFWRKFWKVFMWIMYYSFLIVGWLLLFKWWVCFYLICKFRYWSILWLMLAWLLMFVCVVIRIMKGIYG